MSIALINGNIFTTGKILHKKAILVDGTLITGIVNEDEIPSEYSRKDLERHNIAPSFIDLQIYGGNGLMFSHELSVESIEATYQYCRSGGACNFMITMATNSMEKFFRGIEVVNEYWKKGRKGLLGLHLEGPYLNPVKKGAHLERYIKRPTIEEVARLIEKGNGIIKMMTLAPEMCGESIIQLLLKNKIIVSAGHSNATFKEATTSFNGGIRAATHLFNAMSPFQSREPGMVGAIYDHPRVKSSVVCDGIHVDFAAIRISKRLMEKRLFFITDAVTEIKEGEYHHIFRGDRYTLPDGTLSGSSLTMMKCVKNAVEQLDISLEEAIRMASHYPASLLEERCQLGDIKTGNKASFVVFDDTFKIKEVIAEGESFSP